MRQWSRAGSLWGTLTPETQLGGRTAENPPMKITAYIIWMLMVVWVAAGIVLSLLEGQGHDLSGYGAAWGLICGMPLIFFGLPASIILFRAGVAADRRTRREQEPVKLRDD